MSTTGRQTAQTPQYDTDAAQLPRAIAGEQMAMPHPCPSPLIQTFPRRIVNPDGMPGPAAAEAAQSVVNIPLPSTYFMGTGFTKTPYSPFLPTPELGGAPNVPISLAQLLMELQRNPAAVQPPFDNTISDAQLAVIEPALETSDLFLLRTGATGAAGKTGPDTRVSHLYGAIDVKP